MMNNNNSLSYPTPVLTAIVGKPKAATLRTIRREVYANARAVPSLANGQRGHLGVIMPAAEYLVLAGAAYIPPPPPGAPPAPLGTVQALLLAQQQYVDAKEAYSTYIQLITDLKQQMLTAIDEEYLEVLRDDEQGYADVSVQGMLARLFTTYGNLTAADLVENQDDLKTAWDPTKPIAGLWSKIAEIKRTAATGGAPLNDVIVIEHTLTSLRAAGVYNRLVEAWEEKELTDQTWDNFKIHVNKHEKIRLRNASLKDAGYGAALKMDEKTI
ncbi:MAG: hypothetical protein SGARI_001528, partial [Bacillariaceae sp.]